MKSFVALFFQKSLYIFCFLLLSFCPIQYKHSPLSRQTYHQEIEPYVRFLKSQNQNPVDYIMGLFESYDVVILSERVHPESTQYDMIYHLVSDPRFISKVGNVFMEIGSSNYQPAVNNYLLNDQSSEEHSQQLLFDIYRNFSFYPVWGYTNLFCFYKKIKDLNHSLPERKKVHLYPSDVPFSWDGMDKQKYKLFDEKLTSRDKIIATEIQEKFNSIRVSSEKREKALVIVNFRHAFSHLDLFDSGKPLQIKNVGGFLMEAYPGKVANVMINSISILPGSTHLEVKIAPIQQGKWDAAFSVLNNPEIGFDFGNSPFGVDTFDYFYPPEALKYRYQDIFTGLIFYKPLSEHRFLRGIPGLIEDSFTPELTRRYQIEDETQSLDSIMQKIDALKKVGSSTYEENDLQIQGKDLMKRIQNWL